MAVLDRRTEVVGRLSRRRRTHRHAEFHTGLAVLGDGACGVIGAAVGIGASVAWVLCERCYDHGTDYRHLLG